MTAATLTGSARSATLDNPDNRIANLANFTSVAVRLAIFNLSLTDTAPITGTCRLRSLG